MAITLSRVLLFFVVAWIGIYVLAYYWIMAPTKQIDNISSTSSIKTELKKSIPSYSSSSNRVLSVGSSTTTIPLSNPFVSKICKSKIATYSSSETKESIAIIIALRNEQYPEDVITSLKSLLLHSGNNLKEILIIDDFSYYLVESWPIWMKEVDLKQKITILRTKHTLGLSGAKKYGAKQAQERNSDLQSIVFVDAPIIVSEGWLIPIMDNLQKHPKAIVYPSIDIWSSEGFIESDEVVGGFDWALNFIWEPIDSSRMPLLPSITTKDSPISSPAAPGILAMNLNFYNEVGGHESGLRLWGHDSLELSLRVWLCGGQVIKQPCSRVTRRYQNVFNDIPSGNAVTQAIVDMNVMSIAERYMRPMTHGINYEETVFQARFTGRIPYSVEISQSERFSKNMANVKLFSDGMCQSFDWYLREIYPGLLLDREAVLTTFQQYIATQSSYEQLLAPLIHQYMKKHSDITVDIKEMTRLDRLAHTPDERRIQELHDSFIPKKANYQQPQKTMDQFKKERLNALSRLPPPTNKPTFVPIILGKTQEVDEHEIHANKVREQLICTDEPEVASSQSCSKRIEEDSNICETDKYYMYFGCPASCGLCGMDGKICFDFYEKKCPLWKAEGRCNEEIMTHTCRKTCNLCTPLPKAILPIVQVEEPVKMDTDTNHIQLIVPLKLPESVAIVPAVAAAATVATTTTTGIVLDNNKNVIPPIEAIRPPKLPTGEDVSSEQLAHQSHDHGNGNGNSNGNDEIDPYTAQKQYASGNLPDPGDTPMDSMVNCDINGRPNGEALARIALHSKDSLAIAKARPFKIFCGIYTYEKNHLTNVQATKETWAKRCDGFIAMSTKNDPMIPSVAISHEGPESYDNMWQKSRSIWKYVASRFMNDFDFFLLGGDDMFYIIENLRYYLGTDRNVTERFDSGKGLFIGRRFFPPKQHVFNSGGAGYILDKSALRILASHIDGPPCFPHQVGFWEDVNVANCLRETGNILPLDTRDALQRERFHPFQPGNHLTYRPPKDTRDWYVDYNPYLKLGYECCSVDSISYHYAPAEDLKRLHRFLYHCKTKELTSLFGNV